MAENFLSEVEKLGRNLIKEAKNTEIDIRDRIAIFSNAVKFAAVKNKLEPDGGEEGDGWNKYRNGNGFGGKSGEPAKKEGATPPSAARNTHRPANDTDAARDSAEKERSLRTTDIGLDDGPFPNTGAEGCSFPVNDRGVRIEHSGSEPAGNTTPDSSGDL